MAPHSSTLAWKIPWTEVLAGCSPWGPEGRTRLSDFTFTFHFHALEKEMATHSSVLAWRIRGMGGAWWAAVYGVTQSWTRLKRLSSSSSITMKTTWFANSLVVQWLGSSLPLQPAEVPTLAQELRSPQAVCCQKNTPKPTPSK